MTKQLIRFGRRIPIPSTVQIRHELRAFCAEEDVREECAKAEGLSVQASWEDIYSHRAAANRAHEAERRDDVRVS
jgi:hypothetical protein